MISRPELPILVFGDDHTDPATYIILKKLLPILIQKGYTQFLAEYPKDRNLERHMDDTLKQINFANYARSIAIKHNLDIKNANDYAKIAEIPEIKKIILQITNCKNQFTEFAKIISRHAGHCAKLDFLQELKTGKIKYQSVCSEDAIDSVNDY